MIYTLTILLGIGVYIMGMWVTMITQMARGDSSYKYIDSGAHPASAYNLSLVILWPLYWILRVFCDPREKAYPDDK